MGQQELCKEVTPSGAAKLLAAADHILILSHHNPDGDTLGSAFGLKAALDVLGKQSAVLCSDPMPAKFSYFAFEQALEFMPELIVAVDIADTQLFGAKLACYEKQVDLCIDHHVSNTRFAKALCLDAAAAATAEIMVEVVHCLGVPVTKKIADPLYTGIATDTGCFKFSNTTGDTHRVAAELIECGADMTSINRQMFDTKTRARIRVEQAALSSMEFYNEGCCAVIVIPRSLVEETNVDESDLDGVSAMPRQVEGVMAGVTLREKEGFYKISIRTVEPVNASDICGELGGGGHARAAGCTLKGPLEEVKREILRVVEKHLA